MGFGFWIVAGLIAFGVGVYLLRAMAQGGGAQDALDDAAPMALALYRDQLGEVERDLARGTIAPSEADRLRAEVQRRMLEVGRARAAAAPGSVSAFAQRIAIGAVFLALGAAGALYFSYGAPGYPDMPLSKRLAMAEANYAGRPTQAEAEAAAPVSAPAAPDAETGALMAQLRATVAKRPSDVQGLTFLARNEALLGNFAAAGRAYTALIAAKGDLADPSDRIGAAQALIAAAGGVVTLQAEGHLTAALRLDPTNGLARYFSGLMFAQIGRPDRAFALWEPLLREGPPDAPWTAPITALLPEVADAAGIKYLAPAALDQIAGPGADDLNAAADMSEDERAVMINTMVTGLEARLLEAGGTGEEWARLITSLGILGETPRAELALRAARAEMAADPAAMQLILDAATQAGLAP